MVSVPNAGEAQWNRVSGTIEAHWPDGTITGALLHEQNVGDFVQAVPTLGGGQFFVSAGETTITFRLRGDQGRQLLAPVLSTWGILFPSQVNLNGVTLHRPNDPDWYGINPFVSYIATDGSAAITCVWLLTPEAGARQVQAEAQRRAEMEAQAQALTADTPMRSLRWAELHWWYDEWDDGEAVHIECPVCRAFSPSAEQIAGLSIYALDALPCMTPCTTCHRTVWLTRELLRETAESSVD